MKLSNTEIQEIHTILEKYCNSKEARYVCYKSMLLLK